MAEKHLEEESGLGEERFTCDCVRSVLPTSAVPETADGRRLVAADVLGGSRRLELPQRVLPVLPERSDGSFGARVKIWSFWVLRNEPEVGGGCCCSSDRMGGSGGFLEVRRRGLDARRGFLERVEEFEGGGEFRTETAAGVCSGAFGLWGEMEVMARCFWKVEVR